jgi:hypothetical protein
MIHIEHERVQFDDVSATGTLAVIAIGNCAGSRPDHLDWFRHSPSDEPGGNPSNDHPHAQRNEQRNVDRFAERRK